MVQLEWFIYGAFVGWLAQPTWEVIKKIVSEWLNLYWAWYLCYRHVFIVDEQYLPQVLETC